MGEDRSARQDRVSQLPRRLRQLSWATWRGVLKRSVKGFLDDNCVDWAAALTYYAVLAVFPSAIVVVALTGLVADTPDAIEAVLDVGRDLAPSGVMAALEEPIRQVASAQGPAKVLFSVGLIGAIWSASSYVGGFTRASNAIYGVPEGRRWFVLRPLQLLITTVALTLLAAIVLGLVVSGPVARVIGDALRIGETPMTVWQIGKWPVLVVLASLVMSMLFWIAPNVQQPRFRWLTVGGLVTLVGSLLVSLGFGLYVANLGSYDVTYGSLGAVIAFLVWLYLINCVVLLGVEVNAEVARGRALQAGRDAEHGPALPPRSPAAPAAERASA
jgi:membrane protein